MKSLISASLFLIIASSQLPDLAAESSSSVDSSASVKIALLTDLSGVGAYWGKQSVLGARIAAKEISSGSRPLELVIGDHNLDTKTAITETQRVLMIDKVDAVMLEFAPTAVAASPVIEKHKKLFFNSSAAVSILADNPYAVTAYLDYEEGCRKIAQYWQGKRLERVGVLKPNAEFAELCLGGVKKIYPRAVVQEYAFGESVRSQVLNLKKRRVQAVFNPGLEGDLLNMLKVLDDLDCRVPIATTRQDGITQQVLYRFSHMLDGAVSFGLPTVSLDFVRKIKAYDADNSFVGIEAAAYAYAYIHQIYRALISCKSSDLDCQMTQLAKSPADPLIAFQGWHQRRAHYAYLLEEWYGPYSYRLNHGLGSNGK